MRVLFHHCGYSDLGDEISSSFEGSDYGFSEFFADGRYMCLESHRVHSELCLTHSPYCLQYIYFTFWIGLVSHEILEYAILLV